MTEPRRVALTIGRVVAIAFALMMAGCLVYQAQQNAAPEKPREQPVIDDAEAASLNSQLSDGVPADRDALFPGVVVTSPEPSSEEEDDTLMGSSKSANVYLTPEIAERLGLGEEVVEALRELELAGESGPGALAEMLARRKVRSSGDDDGSPPDGDM